MRFLTKMFAGQSLISWIFQITLIYVAWMVAEHRLENNLMTITGVAVLLICTYISLANDRKHHQQ